MIGVSAALIGLDAVVRGRARFVGGGLAVLRGVIGVAGLGPRLEVTPYRGKLRHA